MDVSSSTEPLSFLSGVVEGFYGRPWTDEQRQTLFRWMSQMNLAVYMYAPKDDMKHRTNWRDLYSTEETVQLQKIICNARDSGVHFVYAISPGLSISYSSKQDRETLMAKFEQVAGLGCTGFALLFDDINPELGEEDAEAFKSEGHAQADLTSDIFERLGNPKPFLFCPTEYCSVRARPNITESTYLQDIGTYLAQDIDVLWTGPLVLSRFVSPEEIMSVLSPVLQRAPILWDNLHNNDYDMRRLHLGPVDGRPSFLRSQGLRGLLANPNVQLEMNYVPLHTLGQWCVAVGGDFNKEAAHERALTAWMAELYPGNSIEMVEEKERLTIDDLKFLTDHFYLPYEYGENARRFLDFIRWLFNNSHLKTTDGFISRETFIRYCQTQWKSIYSRLTFVPNREVAYVLNPYVTDARFVCGAVLRYIMCLKNCARPCHCFRFEAREAWNLRGGWFSEVETLLPEIRLDPVPSGSHLSEPAVYIIRPVFTTDRNEIEQILSDPVLMEDNQSEKMEDGEAELAVDMIGFAVRRNVKSLSSSIKSHILVLESGGPIEAMVQVFLDWRTVIDALPQLASDQRIVDHVNEVMAATAVLEDGGWRMRMEEEEKATCALLFFRLSSSCPSAAVSRLLRAAVSSVRSSPVLCLVPNMPRIPADEGSSSPGADTSVDGVIREWRDASIHEIGAFIAMDVTCRGNVFSLFTHYPCSSS